MIQKLCATVRVAENVLEVPFKPSKLKGDSNYCPDTLLSLRNQKTNYKKTLTTIFFLNYVCSVGLLGLVS